MGQYYIVVNLDRKEYINPHKFGDGLKLLEFGCNGNGTLTGLTVLLADGNGRGGGDLRSDNPVIGSWKGDRIVVAGDYADPWNMVPEDLRMQMFEKEVRGQINRDDVEPDADKIVQYAKSCCNVYNLARWFFKDVSDEAIQAMMDDEYLADSLKDRKQFSPKKEAKKLLRTAQQTLPSLKEKNDTKRVDGLFDRIGEISKEIEDLKDNVITSGLGSEVITARALKD